MEGNIEHEVCANCKKDIPQHNYVMHTMHCARNITLCKTCNEPIPKNQFENHRKTCTKPIVKKPSPPPSVLEKSPYFQQRKTVEDQKAAIRKENYLKKQERLIDTGFTLKESVRSGVSNTTNKLASCSVQDKQEKKENLSNCTSGNQSTGAKPKTPSSLIACRYCDLELPKADLEGHENYCGTRTDKCLECGELVMFKNKQVHLDSNHGFVKLKDEPGPRPSWDSTTQRTSSSSYVSRSSSLNPIDSPVRRRSYRSPLTDFDYDPMPYMPSAYQPNGAIPKNKEKESYKEISRRLDCPAPQPPRRRNPPTELVIPCEFCNVPIPHEELIEHETGCRPDLARFVPRRNRQDEDDYFTAPRASSPEAELPCEFCADMVPASQLLRHQLNCTTSTSAIA